MGERLKNCWEIMRCGRGKGGSKARELGECTASSEGLGHSCWVAAGTFCKGETRGTNAKKEHSCVVCKVYRKYNRIVGTDGKMVITKYPQEQNKYTALLAGDKK